MNMRTMNNKNELFGFALPVHRHLIKTTLNLLNGERIGSIANDQDKTENQPDENGRGHNWEQ